MFDFKKGKSSDKVLTEKEIQQKLYGRFLDSKNSVAGAAESYSRPTPAPTPSPKPASSSASAVLFPEEAAEDVQVTARQPDLISEAPAEKKEERKDFSREAYSSSKDAERGRFKTIQNDNLRTVRTKVQSPKISFTKNLPQLPKIPIGQFFTAVGNAFTVLFNAIFGVFFALSKVVDFRKEGVRTGLAWGSGVVMLVLLLAAIHGLNSKREIAMKTSVPKAPKKVTAKASLAKAKSAAVEPNKTRTDEAVKLAEINETPLSPVKDKTAETQESANVSKGRFVIQVATYVIRDDANRLLEDMKKTDLSCFVKTQSRSSGKTYYSVLIGRFESYQNAQQALAKFKKTDLSRSFKDAFIRTIDA